MSEYIPVFVALIAGPLAVLVTVYFSRDKVRADASKTLTDISLSLIEPQKQRISDLERRIVDMAKQIDRLEAENEALHAWAQHLVAQVIEGGAEPVPFDSSFLPGREDG